MSPAPGIVAVISSLSMLGALGFLIVVDAVQQGLGQERRVGFSCRVILVVSAGLTFGIAFALRAADGPLRRDNVVT